MSSLLPETLPSTDAEWLEPDGLGGFASGTVGLERTRRYHALLLTARTPPTERFVLVNGLEVEVETDAGRFALSAQRYAGGDGDVIHPDGATRIVGFASDPWPTWRFVVPTSAGSCTILHEVVACGARTLVGWRVEGDAVGMRLAVRPLLSGRDYHALQRQNDAWNFSFAQPADGIWCWQPYAGVPSIAVAAPGASFTPAPDWYRAFVYRNERERGLDAVEDLAMPGTFHFDLARQPATLVFGTSAEDVAVEPDAIRESERLRREAFPDPLDRAAEAYLVRRGDGRTIVAGYPWFTDWGRDTFLALRGLCLARKRRDIARDILVAWSSSVSAGMLPNRFPDRGEQPEYNSVDASLWYVVAVGEYLGLVDPVGEATFSCTPVATPAGSAPVADGDTRRLVQAIEAILEGYSEGTRFGIRMDSDGLLFCGAPGVQLTWMDARVGDRVITPRIGKPVEVQALWLNALAIGSRLSPRWRPVFERGLASFRRRFWNDERGCLYDVVDSNRLTGFDDAALRPNQILAVGGLPLVLLGRKRAKQVVDVVERELLTPLGLRTLAPGEPEYQGRYQGGVAERDGAYHQGTVWPWLLGPFVEAWVRVRGASPAVLDEATKRFVGPLRVHLGEAGLGHVSEIADAEAPHAPRGCPFQAWSLAELLRLERVVLSRAERNEVGARRAA